MINPKMAGELNPIAEAMYSGLQQLGQQVSTMGLVQQQLVDEIHKNVSHNPNVSMDNNLNRMNSLGSIVLKHIKPPVFSGERDSPDLEVWLSQIEEYFRLVEVELTPLQKIVAAGMLLKGQAATWYLDLRRKPESLLYSWDDFMKQIKLVFMPVNRERLARDRMANACHPRIPTTCGDYSWLSLTFPKVRSWTDM